MLQVAAAIFLVAVALILVTLNLKPTDIGEGLIMWRFQSS